ncbi:UNVERIFIED_CONTAM: hypothetical protein Sindi_0055900 [Sesamum indicum]
MMWHATHQRKEGSTCHPSDVEAWKYFDRTYPDFIEESRNVWLGLCTDSFAPDGRVVAVVACGERTHDNATDNSFIILVALMWTMNDLPANGMASGWSSVGGDQILDKVADISPVVKMPLTLLSDYGRDHKWTKKASLGIFHTGQRT